MTSQTLMEGVLDAKCPRGSGERKFWKAWCRQWARFSIFFPSGRREPHLVLNLSHSTPDVPEKEIKIARDGLRLFRCRSKTRPYRTWAIASGYKVVLYFAAETEIEAQNWMQAVRDGVWPPCFSFQMLTACSYEVSLIDDDNTFQAGLLGVYGRFVLNSNDAIALMHPHWGSTSLEISLDNVLDVQLIREAESSPAGVFSIILNRVEGSKIKALQFFCKTAKDAIQWILSKVYAKRKSFISCENEEIVEQRTFNLIHEGSIMPEAEQQADSEKKLISSDPSIPNHRSNLQNELSDSVKLGTLNEYLSPHINNGFKILYDRPKINIETASRESSMDQTKIHVFSEELKNVNGSGNLASKPNENTYASIINETTFTGIKESSVSDATAKFKNNCGKEESKINSGLFSDITLEEGEYATVNKSNSSKNIYSQTPKKYVLTNQSPMSVTNSNTLEISMLHDGELPNTSQSDKDSMANSFLMPDQPNNFLDTGLTFSNLRNQTSGSSSSEEDTDKLLWLINESNNTSSDEHVYEEILDRKDTIYEEIDASDDEPTTKSKETPSAPDLPKRPKNLEIPDSLRLQKLSNNIQHTLHMMEDTHLKKDYARPNLIKKITDVNRIMQVTPATTVESKFKLASHMPHS